MLHPTGMGRGLWVIACLFFLRGEKRQNCGNLVVNQYFHNFPYSKPVFFTILPQKKTVTLRKFVLSFLEKTFCLHEGARRSHNIR